MTVKKLLHITFMHTLTLTLLSIHILIYIQFHYKMTSLPCVLLILRMINNHLKPLFAVTDLLFSTVRKQWEMTRHKSLYNLLSSIEDSLYTVWEAMC